MEVFQIIKSSEVLGGGKESITNKCSVLIFVEDVSAVNHRFKLTS